MPLRILQTIVALISLVMLGRLDATDLPTNFIEDHVAGGLSSPTAMAFAPDGRLFVCEQGGALKIVSGSTVTTALSLSVDSNGERGLLGVAFDSSFSSNGWIYLYYTVPGSSAHNRVSRFTVSGGGAGSEVVLLELDNLIATNHNGGALHIGTDGKLYVAVGENANAANAQSLANLHGKILRINTDGSIPDDNPFFTATSGRNRSIWALGLRNPFTFAIRSDGLMYINDVGQSSWEEINRGSPGANYGWPSSEGSNGVQPGHTGPVHAYSTSMGCAITGGAFYPMSGGPFPSTYNGRFFFGDFCGNFIRVLDPNTGSTTSFATSTASSLVDIRVRDGQLYYLSRGAGAVKRIRYVSQSTPPSITQQPQNATVSVGNSVTFSVGASGTAPLAYRWQRNDADISGATGSSYTRSNAQTADNGAVFRVIVSNASGSATSAGATLTVTSNTAPSATITGPSDGATFAAGDVITYSGSANDAEDGTLPASRFTWWIDLHHDTHNHPAMPSTSGSTTGSFTTANQGETSANIWYRIHLRVVDSGGLTTEVIRDVRPRTVTVTLATQPSGLALTLDGQPAPGSFVGVVGMQRTLGAPSQASGGSTWVFDRWSDGGSATHLVATPSSATTYTAFFRVADQSPYGGTARAAPGTIQAEDFDNGGEGVAYHDNDANNNGGGYRSTGVDVRGCSDTGGGWQVGWFSGGEWLEYTVAVATSGTYDLGVRVSSGSSGATIRVAVDGVDATGALTFGSTGGWDTFNTVTASGVNLTAGQHVLRLTCDSGSLDCNWLSLGLGGGGGGIVSGGWYKLVAKHSGKCLEVAGGSTNDGADVRQWSDNGSTAQQWRIDAVGNGLWTLTAGCSFKALDVAAGSTGDGADVIQWTPHTGANQRWRIEPNGDGWFRLVASHSSKSLDVAAASSQDGANVLQWTTHDGDNQRWGIIPIAPTGFADAGEARHGVSNVQDFLFPASDLTLTLAMVR